MLTNIHEITPIYLQYKIMLRLSKDKIYSDLKIHVILSPLAIQAVVLKAKLDHSALGLCQRRHLGCSGYHASYKSHFNRFL